MLLQILLALTAVAPSLQVPLSTSTSTDSQPAGKATPGTAKRRPLTFDADGFFQVSIFEDLHFGENAWDTWGPQQDINSVKVLNKVLDKENPGLVVLNGDLITGENSFFDNATVYVDKIVQPLVQRGLTWASTYGNHDSDFNISRAGILEREQLWPGCRTRNMVPGDDVGVSNYYLPVYAPECKHCGCAPELMLWFFDSRGGFLYQQKHADGSRVGQPDWVDASVADWFQKTNARISKRFQKVIPSLAFVHIPTYASAALQTEHGRNSVDAHREPGINDDYELAPQAQGWCADGRNDGTCSYGGQDVPFMQALVSTPGLIGVFSGHDHGATWCYKWDHLVAGMNVAGNGVNLCFGQHSGYGGYGNWIRGARQVRLSRDVLRNRTWEAETWIRLESGAVVGSVTLNSTYGMDLYPATPNDMTYCPTCNYSVVTPGPPNKEAKNKVLKAADVAGKDQTDMSHGEWVVSESKQKHV